MRYLCLLFFCLSSLYSRSQTEAIGNGIGLFDPFDRLIICPNQALPTAMPFLGIGSNCFTQSFNPIRVVAPELDAIINSDQNPALLSQPTPYHAVQVDYTPWQATFNATNSYALKLSLQKQFGKAGSFDFRYENYSVSPSLDFSKRNSFSFIPRMQVARLAYANAISEHWSAGIAAKYAHQNPPASFSFTSSKKVGVLAADLGIKYQNSKALSERHRLLWQWGFSLSNLGSRIASESTDNQRYPLPTALSTGFLIEQDLKFYNDQSLRVRATYQLNKLLTPALCSDCDDNLNLIPDYLEYGTVEGMLASFTDAPGGLAEELKEVNHQFEMGATYMFSQRFGLRSQLTLFYQHPEKGGIQFFNTQIGIQWRRFQFDLTDFNPLHQDNSGNIALRIGYQHF